MKCEAAAAILESEGPAPVSIGRQKARSSGDFAQHVDGRICTQQKIGLSNGHIFVSKSQLECLTPNPI